MALSSQKDPPGDVLTVELLRNVFGIKAKITSDPETGAPLIIPTQAVEKPVPPNLEREAANQMTQSRDQAPLQRHLVGLTRLRSIVRLEF